MSTRVLLTGAGSGTANNFVRSLKAADPSLTIVGCQDDPFRLKSSTADRNWLVPPAGQPAYWRALRRVAERERIDVLIPTTDADVDLASRVAPRLPCRTLLPGPRVVGLCQDKYALGAHLGARGIPVARTYAVTRLSELPKIFRQLPGRSPRWCRMKTGAGSMAATAVRTPAQARQWIEYWRDMRGIAVRAFTVSEYLPGRDFACQSLWKDGSLVVLKTVERLSYFDGWSRPSGVSSVAALAKSVREPAVAAVCIDAIKALGPRISGAFSVDLKQRVDGTPCVTEINAGRFITMLGFFDAIGKHNMSAIYVRLAAGEAVDVRGDYDAPEDYYFIRDVDTPPAVFHASELFDGIRDARRTA